MSGKIVRYYLIANFIVPQRGVMASRTPLREEDIPSVKSQMSKRADIIYFKDFKTGEPKLLNVNQAMMVELERQEIGEGIIIPSEAEKQRVLQN